VGESASHDHDDGKVDHVLGTGLIVTDAAAVLADPREGALDYPTSWEYHEALLAVGGVYLLATLCPVIFPAWRQMDRRAPA
jgi:hypothetical protein